MENVKRHFEEEAEEFDGIIIRLIPHYSEIINGLVEAIPFGKDVPIKVIDLGCGTGTISKKVKDAFPNAIITCLDIAPNMIEVTKEKMSRYQNIHYQVGDFLSYEFGGNYDVVVSSLALHHLPTDNDKQTFYQKIFNSLHPGGLFFNADIVLGSNELFQEMYMNKWKSFMRKNVTEEEIENKWMHVYRTEDSPSRLSDQLKWLENIGFCEVDVLWKYYNFALYGGFKPKANNENM